MENAQPQARQGRRVRWGLLLVLALVCVLILGGILVVAGIASLVHGKTVSVKPNSTLVMSFNRPLQETPPDPFLTQLFHADVYSVYEVTSALDKAAIDPRINNVLIDLRGFSAGFGQIQDVREAVARFRKKSHKQVWTYFESTGNGGYYLASATDKIYAPPSAYLALTGLAVQVPFYRGVLDHFGIEPELYHIGDYKSYSDIFMRKKMREAQKVATNAILNSLYGQLVDGISRGRNISVEGVKKIINDKGLLMGNHLKDLKLVDGQWYEDQVADALKKANGNKEKWRHISLINYLKDNRVDPSSGATKTIALVVASGGIVSGEGSGTSMASGANIGSATVTQWLKKAARDSSVKAVVFRVNSPGGSGLASDVIWREVELLKKKKPVVVSMSNVAGSGGYYISMGANAIVAQPGTITGSIGVVSGKFVFKGLLDRFGYHQEALRRGKNSTMMSAYVPFNKDQEALIYKQMKGFYDMFVNKAAEGRGKTPKYIDNIGQGRIWSGEDALKNGLVDKLGGIDTAIALAKEKAGIKASEKVRIKLYPPPKSFIQTLFDTGLEDVTHARSVSQMPPELARAYKDYESLKPLLSDPAVLVTPVVVEVN